MLPPYNFYWFRIDTKHMTEPWLDHAQMNSAYRSAPPTLHCAIILRGLKRFFLENSWFFYYMYKVFSFIPPTSLNEVGTFGTLFWKLLPLKPIPPKFPHHLNPFCVPLHRKVKQTHPWKPKHYTTKLDL